MKRGRKTCHKEENQSAETDPELTDVRIRREGHQNSGSNCILCVQNLSRLRKDRKDSNRTSGDTKTTRSQMKNHTGWDERKMNRTEAKISAAEGESQKSPKIKHRESNKLEGTAGTV